jgi:hypothetical protein
VQNWLLSKFLFLQTKWKFDFIELNICAQEGELLFVKFKSLLF